VFQTWIWLKTLRSLALASFADAKLLDFPPSNITYNVLLIHEIRPYQDNFLFLGFGGSVFG
jgi:hypothetical protein